MAMRSLSIPVFLRLLASLLLLAQGGCMSALTTTAMREALRETLDSLAADPAGSAEDADVSASLATDEAGGESNASISEPQPPSLDEAVERAVARLAGVGELDAPTRATLLAILEKTRPEDWPAAIDAFAASLAAYRPPSRTSDGAAANTPAVAKPPQMAAGSEPDALLVFPASGPPDDGQAPGPTVTAIVFEPPVAAWAGKPGNPPAETVFASPALPSKPAPASMASSIPGPAKLAVIEAARPVGPGPDAAEAAECSTAPRAALEPGRVDEPLAGPEPSALLEPSAGATAPEVVRPVSTGDARVAVEQFPAAAAEPPTPALAVRNACFVSRVRGWGVVERFPEAVFRPGQDVIVYFELESPTTRHSPAGRTTSIDTIFRLFDSTGSQVGQWDFEPIDETCLAPRRDYFARYFVRIPETATPGPCRLEIMVTDLVAGMSSQAHLDLEVRP